MIQLYIYNTIKKVNKAVTNDNIESLVHIVCLRQPVVKNNEFTL